MKIAAIIQARMGSTRLPEKVMRTINGRPMVEIIYHRLLSSEKVDEIIFTIPENNNEKLVGFLSDLDCKIYQGDEDDVLSRYYQAAKKFNIDIIIRITADCPLVDPELVDEMILEFIDKDVDYLSNINPPTYPDGMDVEIFTTEALNIAYISTDSKYNREHVTPFLRNSGNFKTANYSCDTDLSNQRWTVDEPEDLEVVRSVFKYFSPNISFSWRAVRDLSFSKPEIFKKNIKYIRNSGASMNTGQKLWERAKRVIPGGNMLLSKRPEMFLPGHWPVYFSKAKGCNVWDLDNNKYVDMSIMGIGTNILGYGNKEVDDAVREVLSMGNMSTFNCPEEVYLAEKLIDIHPWADMVRFARTGGEANSIAIRIARAASGKDKVAICGYHGWHDWYLSANLGNMQNLTSHILPGLAPNGVPGNLQGTVFPFSYNNISELENLINNEDIGVIKMEVVRNIGPEDDFLQKVRSIATKNNIILIFDECTSGFRETYGGIHKKYGVEPDMAIFGKALGNGYAITSIIGKREIMEAAQISFISSTFWTERIGPVAALKTLEIMDKIKSWEIITSTGLVVRKGWKKLATKYELDIDVWGIPALTGFTFKSENALAYKTFITQEMLSKGYLAGNSVYVSVAHKPDIVDEYFSLLEPVFKRIKECEDGEENIDNLLKGPVCHNGFKRLN